MYLMRDKLKIKKNKCDEKYMKNSYADHLIQVWKQKRNDDNNNNRPRPRRCLNLGRFSVYN